MTFMENGPVTSVAFSIDETEVITASMGNIATLWDIKTGQVIRHFDGHKKGSIITSLAANFCEEDIVKLREKSQCF